MQKTFWTKLLCILRSGLFKSVDIANKKGSVHVAMDIGKHNCLLYFPVDNVEVRLGNDILCVLTDLT